MAATPLLAGLLALKLWAAPCPPLAYLYRVHDNNDSPLAVGIAGVTQLGTSGRDTYISVPPSRVVTVSITGPFGGLPCPGNQSCSFSKSLTIYDLCGNHVADVNANASLSANGLRWGCSQQMLTAGQCVASPGGCGYYDCSGYSFVGYSDSCACNVYHNYNITLGLPNCQTSKSLPAVSYPTPTPVP